MLTKGPDRKTHRLLSQILGWSISFGCLGLIAWRLDFAGAARAIEGFRWPLLLVSLLGLAFGYAFRIVRWAYMLRAAGSQVSSAQCIAPLLGSIALNNLLPLRTGDIVRATIFPAAIGVARSEAIGSIVLERLFDLITLVLFLIWGAMSLGNVTIPTWLLRGSLILATLSLIILISIIILSNRLVKYFDKDSDNSPTSKFIQKAKSLVSEFLSGIQHMSAPKVTLKVFALSFLVWIGESVAYYSLMQGFDVEQSISAAILATAFITLSTLVPSSPGYVGPFHLAAFSVMLLLGANHEVATSFAVLSHLMVWLPTTVAGGVAMLLRPDLFRIDRTGKLT